MNDIVAWKTHDQIRAIVSAITDNLDRGLIEPGDATRRIMQLIEDNEAALDKYWQGVC